MGCTQSTEDLAAKQREWMLPFCYEVLTKRVPSSPHLIFDLSPDSNLSSISLSLATPHYGS